MLLKRLEVNINLIPLPFPFADSLPWNITGVNMVVARAGVSLGALLVCLGGMGLCSLPPISARSSFCSLCCIPWSWFYLCCTLLLWWKAGWVNNHRTLNNLDCWTLSRHWFSYIKVLLAFPWGFGGSQYSQHWGICCLLWSCDFTFALWIWLCVSGGVERALAQELEELILVLIWPPPCCVTLSKSPPWVSGL